MLKPYSEAVIAEIRKHDPDNIIVCGTPRWSQRVDEAALNPIADENVAYTLHFYAGTHGEDVMRAGDTAIEKGLCIFVTEYGPWFDSQGRATESQAFFLLMEAAYNELNT